MTAELKAPIKHSTDLGQALHHTLYLLDPIRRNVEMAMHRLDVLQQIMATLEHPDSQEHLPSGLREATKAWRQMIGPDKVPYVSDCQQAGPH